MSDDTGGHLQAKVSDLLGLLLKKANPLQQSSNNGLRVSQQRANNAPIGNMPPGTSNEVEAEVKEVKNPPGRELQAIRGISRKCPICKEVKYMESFAWTARKSGITRIVGYCVPCFRTYNRNLHRMKTGNKVKACPICLEVSKLVFDHNHKTNEFRGYICRNCNSGLGHFKDDVESLKRAIEYLILDQTKK
jgi:hypothetical protein